MRFYLTVKPFLCYLPMMNHRTTPPPPFIFISEQVRCNLRVVTFIQKSPATMLERKSATLTNEVFIIKMITDYMYSDNNTMIMSLGFLSWTRNLLSFTQPENGYILHNTIRQVENLRYILLNGGEKCIFFKFTIYLDYLSSTSKAIYLFINMFQLHI